MYKSYIVYITKTGSEEEKAHVVTAGKEMRWISVSTGRPVVSLLDQALALIAQDECDPISWTVNERAACDTFYIIAKVKSATISSRGRGHGGMIDG